MSDILSTRQKLSILCQRLRAWKKAKTIGKRDFEKYSKIEYVCGDALAEIERLEQISLRQRKQIMHLRDCGWRLHKLVELHESKNDALLALIVRDRKNTQD